MNKTKIEWCLNPDGTPGYTWNPITGCLKGCSYCYARKLAETRLRDRMLGNLNLAYREVKTLGGETIKTIGSHHFQDPFYPRLWKDRLRNVSYSENQRGIFVCSMGDLFGEGVPEEWTGAVLEQCRRHPDDRFYLLTKQPQNLAKFSPFPDNCWVGVSVTNEVSFQQAMKHLPYVKARVLYLSIEPFLGRILTTKGQLERYIDWLIIGAQTKPYVAPKIEWVMEIVEAADAAGIPVFLKNSLDDLITESLSPGDLAFDDTWGRLLRHNKLRREMPK